MRILAVTSAIVLATAAHAAPLAAAPAGEIECITKDWTDAQYADVAITLMSKSDRPSVAHQRGKDLIVGRMNDCEQTNHWSELAIKTAIEFSVGQIFVQITGNQIAREGGSTAVLDRYFLANRAVMVGLTDGPAIDALQLGPRLVEAGFAPANSRAYKTVSTYFSFLAMREAARDRFLKLDN